VTGGAISVTKVFLFVYVRGMQNSLRRLARRLKEPRYGIGFAFGLLYFFWIFASNRAGTRRRGGAAALASLPPGALPLALFFSSAALALFLLAAWILNGGKADLSLSEAEAQFFFSAPLPSRSVVHYALLRPQVALLGSSLILVLLFRRAPPEGRLQAFAGTWILLSALRLYWLGISFVKASWRESEHRLRRWAATTAALALLGVLLFSLFDAAAVLLRLLAGRDSPSLGAVAEALSSRRLEAVSDLLLVPARALLAPLFVPPGTTVWPRVLAAAAVLAVLYVWVVRAPARYEEATLEGAARRFDRRARRLAGRAFSAPASAGRRGVVPFALPSGGRPELAIVWKNLLSWQRVRLARLGLFVSAACVLLFLLFLFLSRAGVPAQVGISFASVVAVASLGVALFLPIAPRHDLRQDLEYLDVLRAWPLSSVRLVAAELATPWLISVGSLFTGIVLSAAIAAGSLGPGGLPSIALPVLLAVLCVVPAISAFITVIQNGLTLSFPAWFHQKEKRVTSMERTGGGILAMLVTLLVLVVAALPCALAAGLVWLLFGKVLGIWIVPIAALLSSALLWGGVVLAVMALARLYERLDPSLDLGA
jgi:hypothetical protein